MRDKTIKILSVIFILSTFAIMSTGQKGIDKEPIKLNQTNLTNNRVSYTSASKTVCVDGTCRVEIHSIPVFVHEDDQWKNYTEARSLKSIWNYTKIEDPDYPLEVVDYNYTHWVLNVSVAKSKESQAIPLKILNHTDKSEDITLKEGNKSLNNLKRTITDSKKGDLVIIDISKYKGEILNYEVKWGLNSTSVFLNATNGYLLEDDSFDNDTDRAGADQVLELDSFAKADDYAFCGLKFGLSMVLPSNASIISAELDVYRVSGDTGRSITLWEAYNQTWTEGDMDDSCGANAPYCEDAEIWFSEYIMTFTSKAGDQDINHTNLSNQINSSFQGGRGNITFIMNMSSGADHDLSFGSKEHATSTYHPVLFLVYNEMPAAAGGSGDDSQEGFWYFEHDHFNFKISNETGAQVNLTVDGLSSPLALNLSWESFNYTGTYFNTTNINFTMYKNTTLYDIILISYNIVENGTIRGYCNETYEIFDDSKMFYRHIHCKASSSTVNLYENHFDATLNTGSTCTRHHKVGATDGFSERTLSGGGSTILNGTHVDSGTGTSATTGNRSYIISCNNSNGRITMGTVRFRQTGDASFNNHNKGHSASWFTADTTDPAEHNDEVPSDYIISFPNISLYVIDNTNPIIRRYVTYDGLSGYSTPSRTTYNLTTITSTTGVEVAQDFFRAAVFIKVENDSSAYENSIEAVYDNISMTTDNDENSVIGSRFFPFIGHLYDQNNALGQANAYFGWHTQNHLKRDMNWASKYGKQMLLSHCYETLREKKEGDGWWRYSDVKSSALYSGWTYYGNAYDRMWSCYKILYDSWLDDYTDVRTDVRDQMRNSSLSLKLNQQDKIYRRFGIYMTVNNDGMWVNITKTEHAPFLNYSATIGNTEGGFFITHLDNGGSSEFAVYGISCNASDGTILFFDNMTTDNSSSYNSSQFTYQAANDRFYSSAVGYLEPANSTTDWVNYTCYFDVEFLSNDTSTADYLNIHIRANSSLTTSTFNKYRWHFEYYPSGANQCRIDPGGSSQATPVIYHRILAYNLSAGILRNNWQTTANTSAYYPATNTIQPMFYPDHDDSILNQNNYFIVNIADNVREAQLDSNESAMDSWQSTLNSTIDGINWLMEIKESNLLSNDGYVGYSPGLPNHDTGYFGLTIRQWAKVQRASAGNKIDDLPSICYYIRHARNNVSEGESSSQWSKRLALLAAVDSRCAPFSWNQTGYTNTFDSDDYVVELYQEDLFTNPGFENSNCSTIYDNEIGVYYPNNHVTINSSMALVAKTCTNIRITNVQNATIQDAYQINGTTNVTVIISPFPNPVTSQHNWTIYDCLGNGDNESCPRGKHSMLNSTFWNGSGNQWANNVTRHSSFSFDIENASNLTVIVWDGNKTHNYSVNVTTTNKANLTTDYRGYANGSTFTTSASDTILFTLGGVQSGNNGRNCMDPYENMVIVNSSTTLCTGTWSLTDNDDNGVIYLNTSNVVVTCEDSTVLKGNHGYESRGFFVNTTITNVTIQGCTLQNYYEGIKIKPASYSNGHSWYIYNNTFTNNTRRGIYFYGTNTHLIDNTFTGRGIGSSNCLESHGTTTRARVHNNKFTGNCENSIYISYYHDEVNITNNQINNTDIGIHIRDSDKIRIINNTIRNATNNLDSYNGGIFLGRSYGTSATTGNVTVENNTLVDVASFCVASLGAHNVSINNNSCSMVIMENRTYYDANDLWEPPCAVFAVQIFKKWLSYSQETADRRNYTNISLRQNRNISITNNVFNNAQCYVKYQKCDDCSHDISSYKYRRFQFPYFTDPIEYYFPDNFSTIQSHDSGVVNDWFMFIYKWDTGDHNQFNVSNITLNNTEMRFRGISDGNHPMYKLNFYNGSLLNDYNDLINNSDNSTIQANITEYNTTLLNDADLSVKAITAEVPVAGGGSDYGKNVSDEPPVEEPDDDEEGNVIEEIVDTITDKISDVLNLDSSQLGNTFKETYEDIEGFLNKHKYTIIIVILLSFAVAIAYTTYFSKGGLI